MSGGSKCVRDHFRATLTANQKDDGTVKRKMIVIMTHMIVMGAPMAMIIVSFRTIRKS